MSWYIDHMISQDGDRSGLVRGPLRDARARRRAGSLDHQTHAWTRYRDAHGGRLRTGSNRAERIRRVNSPGRRAHAVQNKGFARLPVQGSVIAQAVRRVFTHHDAEAVAFSHNDAMPFVAHRRRQVRVTGRQCLVVVVDGGYGFDLSLSQAA